MMDEGKVRFAVSRWWERPYRMVQTNLREIDASLDPQALIQSVKAMQANVFLFNVGGIVAFYPTALKYHYRNPFLTRDLVGEVLEEAHRHGIRVVGRFDFSKATRPVYEDHPDWFWRTLQGTPVIYNGLYHTCINGGWYRGYALEILREALERYELDGLFFNMFGYQVRDYSGNYYGVCQCVNCQRLFQEMYGQPLPTREDWADPVFLRYVEFRRRTCRDVAAAVYETAKRVRPETGVMLRFDTSDILRLEVNRALDRPLPEWGHWSGEQARWAASFGRGKPYSSAIVHFIDIPYRFVAESGACQALRLAQQLANGAQPDYYVLGTLEQEDTKPYPVVRQLFGYHEAHEELYTGTISAAEVALYHSERSADLLGGRERHLRPTEPFRGMYQILSHSHIPFDIVSDLRMEDPDQEAVLRRYKVILLPNVGCLSDRECQLLEAYVRQGGCLVATGVTGLYDGAGREGETFRLPCLGAARVEAVRHDLRSAYFRIGRKELDFPETRLMVLDGTYLYVAPRDGARPLLRLVPPQRYGPPEKCYPEVESSRPGLLLYRYGAGQTAYLPWQPDLLYHRHGLEEYRSLLAQLVAAFAPAPPVRVEAPPQLEVTVYRQPDRRRTIVHLVNFSGQRGTAYQPPVAAHGVRVGVRLGTGERAVRVWAAVAGRELAPVAAAAAPAPPPPVGSEVAAAGEAEGPTGGTYAVVELPPVGYYEAVVFEGIA